MPGAEPRLDPVVADAAAPDPAVRPRPATPQAVFSQVAPSYDRLNGLLSLGQDRRWRRRAARCLRLPAGARVLDLATGTGGMALSVAAVAPAGVRIVGCDRNQRMLSVARGRVRERFAGHPVPAPVSLVRCLAEALPFPSGVFDAAAVAFAIDDTDDRDACAAELLRVLRPGGQLVLLELSLPGQPLLRGLYRALLRVLAELAAGGRSGGRGPRRGWRHLHQEIVRYQGPLAIRELLRRAGFAGHQWQPLSGGVATVHLARRPA